MALLPQVARAVGGVVPRGTAPSTLPSIFQAAVARANPPNAPFTPSGLPMTLSQAVRGVMPPQAPFEHEHGRGHAYGLARRQPQTSPFVRPTAPPMLLRPSLRAPSSGATYDAIRGTVQSAFANTLPATPSRPPNVPATYGLGDSEDDFAQFGGFSLKGLIHTVGGAVTAVGHTIGSAVTSKVGQAVIGTGLALTGVGAPAAAAIFAATKGVGTLIKPGGNIKGALTGAAQGAIEGVVAANALNIAKGAVSVVKGAGSAVASGVEHVIGGRSPAGPTDTGSGIPGLNPAAMSAAIAAATGHAEDANAAVSQVAQQGNGIQAQIAQAQNTGNDAAVAQLQQAYLEQQQQLAAAQAAAAAAQAAATQLQQGGSSLTPQQTYGAVGAAAQGNAAAQIAAAAPFTPDGTAAAQQAADQAAAASMDAGTGQSGPSGLLAHPVLLLLGVGAVLLVAGKKRRRRVAA